MPKHRVHHVSTHACKAVLTRRERAARMSGPSCAGRALAELKAVQGRAGRRRAERGRPDHAGPGPRGGIARAVPGAMAASEHAGAGRGLGRVRAGTGRGHRGSLGRPRRDAGRGNAGEDRVSAGEGAAPRPDRAMAEEERGTRWGWVACHGTPRPRRGRVSEREREGGRAGLEKERGKAGERRGGSSPRGEGARAAPGRGQGSYARERRSFAG
jgi:hypothetical protein